MTTAYANPQALVSTRWLHERLDDPNLRVIDVSIDPQYVDAPRIPGAVFWNGFTTILGPDLRTRFDAEYVADLLGRSGISNRSTVVAYSDHPALGPWVYWYLTMLGHTDVHVLNGGRRKWTAEGRPLTTTPIEPSATSYVLRGLSSSGRADLDAVKAAAAGFDTTLLDVRTPEEVSGELFLLAPPEPGERAGHIPGSLALYYEEAMNYDGTFRSAEELEGLLAGVGVPSEGPVITYCAVGMRAGHMWFVLSELLGRENVANYDGSWNEWGRLPDTPIV